MGDVVFDWAESCDFFDGVGAGSAKLESGDPSVWGGAVSSGGVSGGVVEVSAAGGRASLLHLDVSACVVDARDWQHVVSLHFWGQCGGLAGTFQVSGFLSVDRIDSDDDAGRD